LVVIREDGYPAFATLRNFDCVGVGDVVYCAGS
jgi:hypothetical protein